MFKIESLLDVVQSLSVKINTMWAHVGSLVDLDWLLLQFTPFSTWAQQLSCLSCFLDAYTPVYRQLNFFVVLISAWETFDNFGKKLFLTPSPKTKSIWLLSRFSHFFDSFFFVKFRNVIYETMYKFNWNLIARTCPTCMGRMCLIIILSHFKLSSSLTPFRRSEVAFFCLFEQLHISSFSVLDLRNTRQRDSEQCDRGKAEFEP